MRLFGCESSYRFLVIIGLNAVVGMPDERWGEAPHAFVVLEAGATATETELRNYARDTSKKGAGHFQTVMPPTAGVFRTL